MPTHVAMFMDGNGRWAQRRGLPRTAGHAAGSENFRKIATYSKDIGLQYLTVYAFSTENWSRPRDEVEGIFNLLRKYLLEAIERMERDRVKMRFWGDLSVLPEELQALLARTRALSDRYEGVQVNICLNYGSRDELTRAARALAGMPPEEITEKSLAACLDSAGIPEPDMLIRPGGETRLSNFLLWQCAYTELFFTQTLWPDFGIAEFNRMLCEYAQRNRRYGGL